MPYIVDDLLRLDRGWSGIDSLNEEQLNRLTNAVNLLDASSALFAPHERLTSSRHRLVNEVRRKFRLQSL